MNNPEQIIIKRLQNVLKGQALYIKEDSLTSDEDKLKQINIILYLNKALSDYENKLNKKKGIEER